MQHFMYAAMCDELSEIKLAAMTPQQRASIEREAKVRVLGTKKTAALSAALMQSVKRIKFA